MSRCIIQGIEEREPVTGKPNRVWLEDEIADVFAGMYLSIQLFDLDLKRINERSAAKQRRLEEWHKMA